MKLSARAIFDHLFRETRVRPLPGAPTAEDYFVAEMQRRADDHRHAQIEVDWRRR